MKIKIGFSKRNCFGSKLIAWWMGTPFSHVYLQFENEIIQASGTHVNTMSDLDFVKKNIVVDSYEIEVDEQVYYMELEKARSKIGLPYAWRQLIDIFLSDIFKSNIHWFHDHKQAYICSELVAGVLKDLKYSAFDWDLDYVTPKDIWHLMLLNIED
jgi:hypothetical protein